MTSLGGFVKIVDHSNMCADVLFESFCMCGPLWCWRVLVCRYACSRFVWNEHEEELRCFAADILLLLLDSFSSSFGPICLFPVLQRLLRVLRLLLLLLRRCVHVGKAAWMPDSCILMQTIDRFSKLVFFGGAETKFSNRDFQFTQFEIRGFTVDYKNSESVKYIFDAPF